MSILTPSSDSSDGCMKARIVHFSNELPNDSLVDVLRHLHIKSKGRNHALLALFLEGAVTALREEVRELERALKDLVRPFEFLSQLAEDAELRRGPLGESIEGMLLSVVEIGTLLSYYEERPHEYYFDPRMMLITGLGIGLLASAAPSLSPRLADMPFVGAEIVRTAFRAGVMVDKVSQSLEPRDTTGRSETWAYVVTGVTEELVQRELDEINGSELTPESSRIFISGYAESSVTISGPPSRLKALFRNSNFFHSVKNIALPVFGGLCHAGHIYNKQHIQSVVKASSLQNFDVKYSSMIPILSTGTGERYHATGPVELFEQIITELLTRPIRWKSVVNSAIKLAGEMDAWECQILVFRESHSVRELLSNLKTALPDLKAVLQDIMPSNFRRCEAQQSARGPMQSRIAIVGMACRYPGDATDPDKYWEVLEQGLDVHKKVPADRFDVDAHTDPTGKRTNTSITPYGCFVDNPGLFDAHFFNMSPREAQETCPMQRLALVTAYEALERSGFVANRTSSTNLSRISTFYGQSSDDYHESNTAQEVGTYFIPGGNRAFGPGRINYFFKFSGPSFNCDTACSSSLATIQIACTSLWSGDTDMPVAGGVNILTNSDAFAGLSNGHFLSKTGCCKTWDSQADGYCRADAVGSIVLKRLEDAEADNDNVLGVILAAATNHSADAISITHPHAGAQADLYQQVMRRAGIDPLDVNYVELHGTGTQAGDSVEMESITNVFAPIHGQRRRSDQPLHIGAVKANVGHGEAAAGVTALMKVLCMLQRNAIPPHVGIKNSLNPSFPTDLDERNVHIPCQKTSWPRPVGRKRVAVVNNFSAAGGNTTVVLEDGPLTDRGPADFRCKHVVAISGKHKSSLRGNVDSMLSFIEANPTVSVADLSYTTCARRVHHNYRIAVPASDVKQLKEILTPHLESVESQKPLDLSGPRSIAFTFTGQGASRHVRSKFFREVPYFRAQILHLAYLAEIQGFPDIIPAIDECDNDEEGLSPIVTHLALVCVEIALAKHWASLGVNPNAVIGHSLGEYAALHVAGVISASDAIFLVGRRARLLEDTCTVSTHLMLAVRGSLSEIRNIAPETSYEVACINGERDIVLSGPKGQMASVMESLKENGLKCHVLDIPYAFHSSQVDLILESYKGIAKSGVIFKAPNLPVISPLLGRVIFDDKTINASYMARAARERVDFAGALRAAEKIRIVNEKTVWLEVGPHPVCCAFIRNTFPPAQFTLPTMRKGEGIWATLADTMSALHCAGVDIDWNEFNLPFEKSLRLLDLPTYAWNNKDYWIQYNGDWNLTKGNNAKTALRAVISSLKTSSVQQIVEEEFTKTTARVIMHSDVMHPDFLDAANGHKMNGCGVVTSSIHADLIYTLANYIGKKSDSNISGRDVNIVNMVVTKGLVAQKDKSKPQIFQVVATADFTLGILDLEWRNVESDGQVGDVFATANVEYGNADSWLREWARVAHLVEGRIEALEKMAKDGTANKLSRSMAYRLFSNLVDYSEKYRGIQSVILDRFEAVANVELHREVTGVWTIQPYFLDSVAHLAGLIMNGSDAMDTAAYYCVTPGWESLRLARSLKAGGKYRSYVKMIPTADDPSIYLGDVYIFEEETIIGMVGSIQFRRYPRILLSRFFSAPDESTPSAETPSTITASRAPKAATAYHPPPAPMNKVLEPEPRLLQSHLEQQQPSSASKPTAMETNITPPTLDSNSNSNSNSITARAITLIANEAALELSELKDEANFAELGVDSLMSLVIAEKFREQLQVTVRGSLFLEYPTVGDLKAWLREYYE